MALSASQQKQLDEDGFLILVDMIDAERVETIIEGIERAYALEGAGAGGEFQREPGCRRLANLVDKGEVFRGAIREPAILACMAHVLGPRFKLSSVNARSADPLSPNRQPLHADMGAVADDDGYWVCNSLWMLDDFTPENGALRVVPGSHRWRQLPQDGMADPLAPHDDEVMITGSRGTVAIMNAHAWHGALANTTPKPRRALHVFYTRWDKPQQQYQKKLLSSDTQARLNPEERALLALDDPHNDFLCQTTTTRSGFLK